jgi:hypothetical protein
MSLPTELMGSLQLRTAMAWQRKDRIEDVTSPFLRDSPGFQLVPELAPRESEAIFDRLSISAFEGTPLEFALRDAQVTALRSSASRPRSASSPPFATAPTVALFRSWSPTPAERIGLDVLVESDDFLTFKCGGDSRLVVTRSSTRASEPQTKASWANTAPS